MPTSPAVDSGAVPAAGNLPLPPWCKATDQWWYGRREVCGVFRKELVIKREGSIVGSITYDAVIYAYTGTSSASASQIGYQIAIVPISWTGEGATGWSVSGSANCPGACRVDTSTFATQRLALNKSATGQSVSHSTLAARTSLNAAGTTATTKPVWSWTFSRPDAIYSETETLDTFLDIRCDNKLPGKTAVGCVVPANAPVLQYGAWEYPDFVRHLKAAVASGLSGSYDAGTYVTRMTNQVYIQKNRDTACPTKYPRPTGKSCDEYPFASTWQGAYSGGITGGALAPRTNSWCSISGVSTSASGYHGYSICMINAQENTDAGNDLLTFYNANRVLDSDRFQVQLY